MKGYFRQGFALFLIFMCPYALSDDLADAYTAIRLGDFSRAAALFRDQALTGSLDAQYQLGKLYLTGRGLNQDIAQGQKWLERAAQDGHSDARQELKEMSNDESELDAPTNPQQSHESWVRAATACRAGELETLLQAGADVQFRDPQLRNALYYQVACSSTEGAALLISYGIAVDNQDTTGLTALMLAVQRRDSSLARLLLKAGANSRAVSASGDSLLHLAVLQNELPIIALLIEAGADASQPNPSGDNPLDLAVRHNHGRAAAVLENSGAKHSTQWLASSSTSASTALDYLHGDSTQGYATDSWPTAVQAAIQDETVLLAAILKDNGPSLMSHEDQRQRTLLMYATESTSTGAIELLVKSGAELNQQNTDGRTALMLATKAGNTQTVTQLLSLGADPTLEDLDGADAIQVALAAGHDKAALEMLQLAGQKHFPEPMRLRYLITAIQNHATGSSRWLLQNQQNTDPRDASGRTLLWHACRHCDRGAMEYLFNSSDDVDTADLGGYTPLHMAADNNCLPAVAELLQAGANLDATSRSGNTPLMLAILGRHDATASLLLENGADISIQNASGDTALLLAANTGSAALVARLLELGGDPYRRNALGQSSLEIVLRDQPELVSLMKSKGGFRLFGF